MDEGFYDFGPDPEWYRERAEDLAEATSEGSTNERGN